MRQANLHFLRYRAAEVQTGPIGCSCFKGSFILAEDPGTQIHLLPITATIQTFASPKRFSERHLWFILMSTFSKLLFVGRRAQEVQERIKLVPYVTESLS
jgi:hypothetical protein